MFILAAMIFSNEKRFYKIYPCVKVQKTGIYYFKFSLISGISSGKKLNI